MPKFVGVNISGTVVGHYLPYGGTVLPANFLWCDGQSYLRTAFPALFAAIGTAFGAADATHFNVPDWRSRFMRGSDNMGTGAAGRDPDARGVMNTGGNATGVGSAQSHAFQGHYHPLTDPSFPTTNRSSRGFAAGPAPGDGSDSPGASGSGGRVISLAGTPQTGQQGTINLSTETRPINGNSNFIIAYI